MKRTYEAPMLIKLGSFRKTTGFLGFRGRDRIILSKHFPH
ncbi:keywimysin-related RiPP [Saccharopolyspora sp. NPDC003752]